MGAEVEITGGTIHAKAPRGLQGAEVALPLPSVGATENLLLAAVLANGRTVIRNAAREPEIADLVHCLAAMGAQIEGVSSGVLTINARQLRTRGACTDAALDCRTNHQPQTASKFFNSPEP